VEAEAAKPAKHVDLLLLGGQAARLMGGGRSSSCKSAKDRTSIFQTLEVGRHLTDAAARADSATSAGLDATVWIGAATSLGELDASGGGGGGAAQGPRTQGPTAVVAHERAVVASLRGLRGVRLANCQLNVGRPKYAFNALQLEALPAELRPPRDTAAGGKS
jgi:hypothetical protein